MFDLRPYQSAALEGVRASFRAGHRKIVLVAPTGAGKTVMGGAMIHGALAKGSRVLFLAHRKELIEQPSAMLARMEIDHGVIKAGHWRHRPQAAVQVASVQTLVNRLDEAPPADLIIVDETHRILATTYTKILDHYQGALVLGLTATPWRLDGRGLGDVFTDLVVSTTVRDLVDSGFLINPRVYAPATPDTSAVKRSGGDFNQKQLAELVDRPELVGDVVEHWQRLAPGRRSVCFAASVEHSNHIVDAFKRAGIAAEHLDATMPDLARDGVLQRLRSGATTVLSNVDIVTEGYDLPELSCCILARPTESITKYLQMVGRIMRPATGKVDAVVLDHANCTGRHGFVIDERDMSLEHSKPKTETVVKICPQCFEVVSKASHVCACGWVFVASESVKRGLPEVIAGDLSEVFATDPCGECGSRDTETRPDAAAYTRMVTCRDCRRVSRVVDLERAKRAPMSEKKREYQRLAGIAKAKGFKDGWISHQYKAIFSVWPKGVK